MAHDILQHPAQLAFLYDIANALAKCAEESIKASLKAINFEYRGGHISYDTENSSWVGLKLGHVILSQNILLVLYGIDNIIDLDLPVPAPSKDTDNV